ncbi:MAG: hypothetical protein V7640_4015 [Betaproteobacteria bacterium]
MQMSLRRKEQSTSPHYRLLSLVALGLALLISLSGCKKEETKQVSQPPAPPPAAQVPPPAPSTPPPSASAAPSPAPSTSAPAETSPSPSAPPSQATATSAASSAQPAASAAGKAIATSDGEKPGSRVEVQELKRVSGGTVMLRFAMINDADQQLNFGYDFGDRNTRDHFANIGGVHLIDAVGKKKYLVVRDSQDQCDCSRNLKDLAPKSRVNLWARFPAPPDNVEKVTVVVPHFSPMDDVSLSR